MVDKPTLNPQNVRRASGKEVPTLRDVQVPNLRGIGRVQPTAARAEQQAAAQTAQVIESVGNSIMRTAGDITARAEARKKEEEKLKQRDIEAQLDIVEQGLQDVQVTAAYADIDSELALGLDRIVAEGGDAGEIASKYAAQVRGMTSEMPEEAAIGLQEFAQVRLDEKLEKVVAEQVQVDNIRAEQNIDDALEIAEAEGIESSSLNTQAEVTKHDAAMTKYFALVDSAPFTPAEKDLKKRQYIAKMQESAALDVISTSDNPRALALSILSGTSSDPELNNLPDAVKAKVVSTAHMQASLREAEENKIKQARAQAEENLLVDELSEIYTDLDNPDNLRRIEELLDAASKYDYGLDFVNQVNRARTAVTGFNDSQDRFVEAEIEKTIDTFIGSSNFDPKQAELDYLREFQQSVSPDTHRRILDKIRGAKAGIFGSTQWDLFLDEVDVTIPDTLPAEIKSQFLINKDYDGLSAATAAYGDGETKRRALITSIKGEIEAQDITDPVLVLEIGRKRLADTLSKINQTQSKGASNVSAGVPNKGMSKSELVKLGELKQNSNLSGIASNYLQNGEIDKERLAADKHLYSDTEFRSIIFLLQNQTF